MTFIRNTVKPVEDDSFQVIQGKDFNYLVRLIIKLEKTLAPGEQREIAKYLSEVLIPNSFSILS
jgi:hypothetical protein